ncbi:hypothetical protein JB92DRAFT_3113124 [Gautieria morchelliformis]|nr:hypothetical protein JB92DRAFT_3113124 [Gautieria morchelliformis]
MAQANLDTQGRIQPRTTISTTKEKQPEQTKRVEVLGEKRVQAGRPATRGAAQDPECLTREEIRDLPGQEIRDSDEGRIYLERTLLTVPGASWTTDTLSTAILQVTQYKGVPRQAVNALRSIAFVMESIEDDTRYERVMCRVKESLAAEGNALSIKVAEATEMLDKATAAADATAKLSRQIAEDAATAINETSTSYRDAMVKVADITQRAPASAPTLDARVRAREGIKQRQVLVDAAALGERILAEMDNAGLMTRANEIISAMDTEGVRTVISTRRLTNGGVLFELNDEAAARWLNGAGKTFSR